MKILIKLKKFLLLQEANFVLLRASQQFISVILGFILIGMLEPTSYGIYIFYFTLISLFFNPLNGGIFFLSLKESSSASDIDKKNRFCELILFSIAASFILSTILITGLIIFNYLFHLAPGHLLIFCIFTISFQFLTVMRVIGAFIQGQNYPIHGQFGESIIRPSAQVGLLLLWNFLFYNISPANAVLIFSFSTIIALCLNLYFARSLLGFRFHLCRRIEFKSYLKRLLPLSYYSSAQLLSVSIEILVLGIVAGDLEVGVFGFALRIAMACSTPTQALSLLISGRIAKAFELQQLQSVATEVRRFSFLGFFSCLTFAAITLFIVQTDIFIIFFGDYNLNVEFLIVMIFAQLISSFFGPVGMMLIMTNQTQTAAMCLVIGTLVSLIFGLVLFAKVGLMGIAIGHCVGITVWNILMSLQLHRIHRIKVFVGLDF